MSNEVKIIVTSDDRSNLPIIERKSRSTGERAGKKFSEGFTSANKDTGSKTGAKVAEDLDKVFGEASLRIGERLADSIAVGAARGESALDDLGTTMEGLDKKIEDQKAHVRELGAEYARTGDKDVFAALRNSRGALANLTSVRKELTDLGDAGDEVGPKLAKSLKDAGKKGGDGLYAGMLEGKAQMMIAGVGLAAVFAGSLNAALMAAGAGGAVGLGALLLKEEPKVIDSAMRMATAVKATLADAAAPMIGPFVDVLGQIQSRMGHLGPTLRETFSAAAPLVEKLVDTLFGLVEGVLPAFNRMVGSSGPVLDALAVGAASVGETVGEMLDIMTADPQKAAESLTALIQTVNALGLVVAWTFRIVQDAMSPVVSAINGLDGAWRSLLGHMAEGEGPIAKIAQGAVAEYESLDRANSATKDWSEASTDATKRAVEFKTAISELSTQLLAMSGSSIAVEAAFDSASESISKNGRTLDINTDKGRANRTSIDAIAAAAIKQQESMKNAGASVSSMNAKMGRAYTQFVKSAHAAGTVSYTHLTLPTTPYV